MNKIIIAEEDIEIVSLNKKIEVNYIPRKDLFSIAKLNIVVLKKADLEIEFKLNNSKLAITIDIKPDVEFNLYEYKSGNKGKIQYVFNQLENSILNINKFQYVDTIKEMLIFNLDGPKAIVNYNFKSITQEKETYDLVVNHNAKLTISNIYNNVVNIDEGKTSIQVSSYVDNGIKGCVVNQNNRIINLTNNKCEIRPNLYIKEFDTSANHSALIGGFSKEELFYLQSRGINQNDANKLLITGFLLSNLTNKKMITKITKTIHSYWR